MNGYTVNIALKADPKEKGAFMIISTTEDRVREVAAKTYPEHTVTSIVPSPWLLAA